MSRRRGKGSSFAHGYAKRLKTPVIVAGTVKKGRASGRGRKMA